MAAVLMSQIRKESFQPVRSVQAQPVLFQQAWYPMCCFQKREKLVASSDYFYFLPQLAQKKRFRFSQVGIRLTHRLQLLLFERHFVLKTQF